MSAQPIEPEFSWTPELDTIWRHWAAFCNFQGPMLSAQREMWKRMAERGLDGALQVEAQSIMAEGREHWRRPEAILNLRLQQHADLLKSGRRTPAMAPRASRLARGYEVGQVWRVPGGWAEIVASHLHLRTLHPCGPGPVMQLDTRAAQSWALEQAPADRSDPIWAEIEELRRQRKIWLASDARPQQWSRNDQHRQNAQARADQARSLQVKPQRAEDRMRATGRPEQPQAAEARTRTRQSDPLLRLRAQYAGYLPGARPEQGGAPEWLITLPHDPEAVISPRRSRPSWCLIPGAVERDIQRASEHARMQALKRLAR